MKGNLVLPTSVAPFEVTRAISLTPWSGDVTFNAASPWRDSIGAEKRQ